MSATRKPKTSRVHRTDGKADRILKRGVRPCVVTNLATWMSMILFLLLLGGCATRPGPETLIPAAGHQTGMKPVAIYAVTDRATTDSAGMVYGSERGSLTYEKFTIMADPAAATGKSETIVRAPSRNPSKGFVTAGRQKFSKSSFDKDVARQQRVHGNTIVVYVHGYNTSYQEALFQLAQSSTDFGTEVIPVLFSWPSQARVFGYVADRDALTYARDDLAELLTTLGAHSERRIAVMGHSAGAWLVMEAMRQLRLQGHDDIISRFRIGLAAPDIDLDVFRAQATVVGRLSPPLTVLVSKNDRALAVSSHLVKGRRRLGAADVNDPVIQAIAHQQGVRILDISALPASSRLNHDRFVTFLSHYSEPAKNSKLAHVFQRAGAYILDAPGTLLSSALKPATRAFADSP